MQQKTSTPPATIVTFHQRRRWLDRDHTKCRTWCGLNVDMTMPTPTATDNTPVIERPCALCEAAKIIEHTRIDHLFN